MRLKQASWLLLPALLTSITTAAAAPRSDGLKKAWADASARRSTFFVEGMTCRACSVAMDVRLSEKDGVYWSRFNYPLRLLTVYHDPKKVPAEAITATVHLAKEFRAVPLASRPAAGYRPSKKSPLATWKGGTAAVADAEGILRPFEANLRKEIRDSEEVIQVRYEILGEAVRNRILLERAKKAGYPGKSAVAQLPEVLAKDFYWPDNLLDVSPSEAAIAGFVTTEVMAGKMNDPKAFDAWLLKLWREIEFDFRGEALEG